MSNSGSGKRIDGDQVGRDKVDHGGDTYNVDNAVAVGRNVRIENSTVSQKISNQHSPIPEDLAGQIAYLREEMKKLSRIEEEAGHDTSEIDEAIGTVTSAKKAIEAGDESKAISYLKSAGTWTLDFASKIGVNLVSELLKQQTGLR